MKVTVFKEFKVYPDGNHPMTIKTGERALEDKYAQYAIDKGYAEELKYIPARRKAAKPPLNKAK